MPAHHPPVPGTSNAGPAGHTSGHKHNPTANYELMGAVRWYDAGSARAVVHVDETNGHAGRYLGEDVTVELAAGADVPHDLLPGARVRVHARMPRDLGTDAPDPIPASSVAVIG